MNQSTRKLLNGNHFNRNVLNRSGIKTALIGCIIGLAGQVFATELPAQVDDFSHDQHNNLGLARLFMNDSTTGGATTTEQTVSDGVIALVGKIVPPRGQPGWASTVLLLDPQGQPRDASQFKGIRLVVKVNRGNINLSANSTEITNFDYHVAPVKIDRYGEFQEIKIPFNSMKRAWSAQTELNTKTLNSISIVAWGMQPTEFDYAIDEVSFY